MSADNERCVCGGPIIYVQYSSTPRCYWCGKCYPPESHQQHQARVLADVKRAVAGKPWSEVEDDDKRRPAD